MPSNLMLLLRLSPILRNRPLHPTKTENCFSDGCSPNFISQHGRPPFFYCFRLSGATPSLALLRHRRSNLWAQKKNRAGSERGSLRKYIFRNIEAISHLLQRIPPKKARMLADTKKRAHTGALQEETRKPSALPDRRCRAFR